LIVLLQLRQLFNTEFIMADLPPKRKN